MALRAIILALAAALGCAQGPVEWVCPMDPDVRSAAPSKCPRCGMKLVAGLPDSVEYPVHIEVTPRAPRPGKDAALRFRIGYPSGKPGTPALQRIHEKLFHLFVVSQDLSFFAHEHPEPQPDGTWIWRGRLPKAGEYRVLSDFYPDGGTPQWNAQTIIVPGPAQKSHIEADTTPKSGANLRVSLETQPARPIAGQKTILFFHLDPPDGLEPYLGARGHMLAASSDLVDTIHTHPAFDDAGPRIQFNLIFPRPGIHRIWVQFQRHGIVNTVAFNVPVAAL